MYEEEEEIIQGQSVCLSVFLSVCLCVYFTRGAHCVKIISSSFFHFCFLQCTSVRPSVYSTKMTADQLKREIAAKLRILYWGQVRRSLVQPFSSIRNGCILFIFWVYISTYLVSLASIQYVRTYVHTSVSLLDLLSFSIDDSGRQQSLIIQLHACVKNKK